MGGRHTVKRFLHQGTRWITLLVVAYGCAGMRTPGSSDAPRGDMPPELRVGTATNYPPLAFKEDGQLRGVEVDLARKLSEELNLKVSVIETPWEALIPALEKGEIDVIMSGMSITEERSRRVQFTIPYLNVGQMALIRKVDRRRLRDRSAMDDPNARVGFLAGTTSEQFARQRLRHATLMPLSSPDEGIAALRAERIDFYIQDAPTIWRITGNLRAEYPDLGGLYRPLTAEHLAWAVRKKDGTLLERLNATLLRWQLNGELEAILDRWIPVRKINVDIRPTR
jgi:ABC-type amino acid transport substrate-binding protein